MARTYHCNSVHRRSPWRKPRRFLPRKSAAVVVKRLALVAHLWYAPRRGYFCDWTAISTTSGEKRFTHPVPEKTMKKKTAAASPAPGDGPRHLAPMESDVFTRLPNLVAHCCVTRYDDGDPRSPGLLMIKTQGSSWVVVVKEPDAAVQMQCLGASLDDALALCDLLLGSDDAPWEVDQWAAKRNTGKKK